jgi:[acyl-carrier-protein] S-malonyltransferase
MAKSLCDSLPAARQLFDEAAAILGYDLLDVCANGPVERLNATVVSQPAIFVASLAALESLRQKEPAAEASCAGTAGLSLGEYTALVFAGAMSFSDGVRLVKLRGEAMQEAADRLPQAMVSVLGLDTGQVEALCKEASVTARGGVEIANILCPGNTVVSGDKWACDELERLAPAAGAMKTIRLPVAGAFHTGFMKPAVEVLAKALATIPFQKPRVPVWANVDARPHTDPEEIKNLLVSQVVEPVLWEHIVRRLLEAGFDKFYEIGPGRVLAGLLKRVDRKAMCVNVSA